jgi:hypothetical protein
MSKVCPDPKLEGPAWYLSCGLLACLARLAKGSACVSLIGSPI